MRPKGNSGKILVWIGALFVLLALLLPVFWQWGYRERLERAVPIGSTRDVYLKALLGDKLGPGDLRPGYTFWRPVQFHGIVYTFVAIPQWDTGEHLTGYGIYSVISFRGHYYGEPPSLMMRD